MDMATTQDRVVINEVLCYMTYNLTRVTSNQLKATVIKCFKDDILSAAKDELIMDVDRVADKPLPRYSKRKGENKTKLTVDDITEI